MFLLIQVELAGRDHCEGQTFSNLRLKNPEFRLKRKFNSGQPAKYEGFSAK